MTKEELQKRIKELKENEKDFLKKMEISNMEDQVKKSLNSDTYQNMNEESREILNDSKWNDIQKKLNIKKEIVTEETKKMYNYLAQEQKDNSKE